MKVIRFFQSDRQAHWLEEIRRSDWSAGAFLHHLISSGTFFDAVGEGSEVLLLTEGGAAFAQAQITVKGRVTDSQGDPVVGAGVVDKASGNGAVTDLDGQYTIKVPSNASLEFSCVGMATKVVPVEGRSLIDIALSSDSNFLETSVVVGYGAQKKGSITGAVVAVGGEEMIRTKTENPQNMLTGRVSGVRVWRPT